MCLTREAQKDSEYGDISYYRSKALKRLIERIVHPWLASFLGLGRSL